MATVSVNLPLNKRRKRKKIRPCTFHGLNFPIPPLQMEEEAVTSFVLSLSLFPGERAKEREERDKSGGYDLASGLDPRFPVVPGTFLGIHLCVPLRARLPFYTTPLQASRYLYPLLISCSLSFSLQKLKEFERFSQLFTRFIKSYSDVLLEQLEEFGDVFDRVRYAWGLFNVCQKLHVRA